MKSALQTQDRAPRMVEDSAGLESLLSALERAPRVGVDTEANSFHAYRERVCLIQLSTGDTDWIVDPLAIDAGALRSLFEDREREVVFHAAEFDIASLKRSYGFEFGTVFDTQMAAMLLGMGQVGYSTLVKRFFGVELQKGQQRSDWGRRPLTPKQIVYAAADVRYLLPLRDRLFSQLEEHGRLAEAVALFARLTEVPPHKRSFDPDGYYGIKGFSDLDATGRSVARSLFLVREQRAERIDKPPFRVFGNNVMLDLAARRPTSKEDLERFQGLPESTRKRFWKGILDAVHQGVGDAAPPPPKRKPRPARGGSSENGEVSLKEIEKRYQRLRSWRNRVARERGVEGQIILRNDVLRDLARELPRSLSEMERLDGMDAYALEAYGSQIIEVLASDPE